jgi:hypothetical protein
MWGLEVGDDWRGDLRVERLRWGLRWKGVGLKL